MKWDYENNQPIEGTYQQREYDKDALKSYIEECFPFDDIRIALDSVDWDLEALMLRNDIDLGDAFYTSLLVDWKDCLRDYWIDIANGNICTADFEGLKWRETSTPIQESDFWRRCFFCETEEDIWDLFHDLPFEMENNLMECYYGYTPITFLPVYIYNPEKAAEMRNYLYGDTKGNNYRPILCYNGNLILVVRKPLASNSCVHTRSLHRNDIARHLV